VTATFTLRCWRLATPRYTGRQCPSLSEAAWWRRAEDGAPLAPGGVEIEAVEMEEAFIARPAYPYFRWRAGLLGIPTSPHAYSTPHHCLPPRPPSALPAGRAYVV